MQPPAADPKSTQGLGPGNAFERPPVSDHKTAKKVLVVSAVILTGGTFGFLLTALPPLLLFGALFGLLGTVVIFAYPYVGLLLYTLLFVIRPGEIYPILAAMHPERVVALLTLAALLFSMIRKERKILVDGSRETALFFGFMIVAYMTVFGSYWPGHTLTRIVEFLKVFAFYLMVVHLIDTRLKLKVFIYTFLALIGYLALSSVKGYYAGDLMFAQGIERAIGATSAGGNPNSMGGSLGSALGLALFIAFTNRGFWVKVLLLLLSAACMWTIALTGSRGTMLGILTAGFFMWALSSRKFLIGLLAIGVLTSVFIMLPDSYKERYSTVTSGEIDGSTQARLDTWRHGLKMFIDRPILGVGLGCFGVAHAKDYSTNRNYLESHSLYVQVPAETGTLGAVTFFAFLIVAIRRNRALNRKINQERPDWGFESSVLNGLFIGFMFLLVFSIFGHSLMRYTWYVFAALGVALGRLHLDLPASSPEPEWIPPEEDNEKLLSGDEPEDLGIPESAEA